MTTTSILERPSHSNESHPPAAAEVSVAVNDLAPAPLLENVIAAICLDARSDLIRYALRSNVGHDGE